MSGEPRRGVFVHVDAETGEVVHWCVCFEPPQIEGLVAVELPFGTDVYSVLQRRVNLAAAREQEDGRPPLAHLANLDS